MAEAPREAFLARVLEVARPSGVRILVNADIGLAQRMGADGVHLTSRQLGTLHSRPDLPWVGASCHDRAELRAAEKLGADFAVLGSVLPTQTHPGVAPLGWERFESIVQEAAIPVYSLGGMRPGDLQTAWSRGGHGIAMQRASWDR